MKRRWFHLPACLVGALALGWTANPSLAQNGMPDHPLITVEGKAYTPLSIVTRNMGTKAEQEVQFPPHKVIGNIYYVGTQTLSSFLVVTPAGNILIDTTYERNVDTIKKSVEQLGFKFSDTKYILGNHAHGDHMEGDFKAKELSGARVVVMAEDVPMLQAMKPGGKEHPIDRVIHDGDTVMLGDVTLTAHLTGGHSHGATTWTMQAKEGGKTYNVVFFSSLRSPAVLTPPVIEEFNHSFAAVRPLPCDVPLGDHPSEYRMLEKYPKIKKGVPNPYIDVAGCKLEAEIEEAMFHAILKEQEQKTSQ